VFFLFLLKKGGKKEHKNLPIKIQMGCDITAYFYVNKNEQNLIEEFIKSNGIDKTNYENGKQIIKYYKSIRPEIAELDIKYSWNKKCQIHKFYDYYQTNFIRDDERLSDRCYQRILEEKYEQEFPYCLMNILWNLHNTRDAIEIADAINVFFPDENHENDEQLAYFADWLRETAKFDVFYEYSF
jgi:hypothetical protein